MEVKKLAGRSFHIPDHHVSHVSNQTKNSQIFPLQREVRKIRLQTAGWESVCWSDWGPGRRRLLEFTACNERLLSLQLTLRCERSNQRNVPTHQDHQEDFPRLLGVQYTSHCRPAEVPGPALGRDRGSRRQGEIRQLISLILLFLTTSHLSLSDHAALCCPE